MRITKYTLQIIIGVALLGVAVLWFRTQDPKRLPSAPVMTKAPATPVPPVSPILPEKKSKLRSFATNEEFLNDLQHRSFLYFWETANRENGLVPDRAKADGSGSGDAASIAAVGFGLTGICIAAERGWVKREQAYERTLRTLRFFADKAQHERGFFYHFLDMKTGQRKERCELSSVDTWLLLSGVLTARQYFRGTEVERLATAIYERVDWTWMMDNGSTLTMGWTPEEGFLNARWAGFSEHLAMHLMAIGSPTFPISPKVWDAWERKPALTRYGEFVYLNYPPLFIHQFPHAWVDFRDMRDRYVDYWQNSRIATLAHKNFCESLQALFPTYGKVWGITSSDGAKGYMDWGGPPRPGDAADPRIDGTVVPCAAGGSIPFAPQECISNLKTMYDTYGSKVYRKYGFVDAFNPLSGWIGEDALGIDVGITLVMAENYRSGFVWSTFMANPEIGRAMKMAGFERTALDASVRQDGKWPFPF